MVKRITEAELRKVVKESVERVLNENVALAMNYDGYDEPMTLNQKMSLNEMAQINVGEMGTDKKSNFNSNAYYVYVKGEGGYKKFQHFHIKSKSEGWDIRMNMDGTFHSIKTKSANRQKPEDFVDIERIAKVWVTQPNALEPDRTNGKVAETAWIRNNK